MMGVSLVQDVSWTNLGEGKKGLRLKKILREKDRRLEKIEGEKYYIFKFK
jgi:hypothetical protein